MGMWVVTSAPLILGLDLRDDSATDVAWPIITNTEVLAVHAAFPAGAGVDPDGNLSSTPFPGRMVATDGVYQAGTVKQISWQVWAKNISDTSVAVLLVNAGETVQDVSVHFDGLVPCRPKGLCEEEHLDVLCARTCPDNGDDNSSANTTVLKVRDLWLRAPLPDVTDNKLVAEQLAPHDSLFVLVTLP